MPLKGFSLLQYIINAKPAWISGPELICIKLRSTAV